MAVFTLSHLFRIWNSLLAAKRKIKKTSKLHQCSIIFYRPLLFRFTQYQENQHFKHTFITQYINIDFDGIT